jgi:hypothetical protein
MQPASTNQDQDADGTADEQTPRSARWTSERARRWHDETGWLCGFNFLPSTAVNFIEMWHEETYDPQTIDRELGWAAEIGFNCVRTNLQFLLWQQDPVSIQERIGAFLTTADKYRIKTVFCLFDDCGFSGGSPKLGRQDAPVPGVHNSRAMASPGRDIVMDRTVWPELELYVRDIVGSFSDDRRVAFWDLYNEPGNLMIFHKNGQKEFSDALEGHSLALLREAFDWARSAGPIQPLTVGGWHIPMPWDSMSTGLYEHTIDQSAFDLSDIISFHAYCGAERMLQIITQLESFGRPIFCTEWMARTIGSRLDEQLSLMKDRQVGSFIWGMVQGRTQTHLPWPGLETVPGGDAGQEPWFHDLLTKQGEPHDERETELISKLTKRRTPY